ncbi:hypothetical protein [Nocardiopsis quinghaiensis]|nr:hypothetical protein [Nocardiopsis quinghaiensis]
MRRNEATRPSGFLGRSARLRTHGAAAVVSGLAELEAAGDSP